ncbi:MAG: AAA family ATPase [Kiritimatiellae bacterium]|nr:AAA family ATPase [Kiritimatiellia bacterium]
MYLKNIDIQGFKSFADRTKLDFDPGLIAIVGPNGCGKSNVSDAIRWVLGEQKPTALRCSKLVDVVFNGTDTRKPLGLAEVSITFADCEKELGTDYHEVTITRRVYRDGTGEYFINRQPSRLRDVQHLFMGTGIGTSSYSVMAQGQIDAILSSKPEDRRAVFEEAAGITKFKADRKDALRKIEQTDQNLLRESDVLREMKRQIAALQRQAGKAQKAKELRDRLRDLDIYVSKCHIHSYDSEMEQNATNRAEIEKAISEAQEIASAAEAESQSLHQQIHEIEERLQSLVSSQTSAESECMRAKELISLNIQRISEYREYARRDGDEVAILSRSLDEQKMQKESLSQKSQLLEDSLEAARMALEEAEDSFEKLNASINEMRIAVQNARTESVQCDRRAVELQEEYMKAKVLRDASAMDAEECVIASLSEAPNGRVKMLDCFVVSDTCKAYAEQMLGTLALTEEGNLVKTALAVRGGKVELRVPKSSVEAGEENAAGVKSLEELGSELQAVRTKRDNLSQYVFEREEELRKLEFQSTDSSRVLTERRIAASQLEQELSFVGQQVAQVDLRIREIETTIETCQNRVSGYEESVARLEAESENLTSSLPELTDKAASFATLIIEEREKRTSLMGRIDEADRSAMQKRADLDQARDFRSKLEVQAAELTMKRQNIYEHLQDEYGLFADAVMRSNDPEWKNGVVPPLEELEKTVANLQAEIAALGPINMVAIEECRELEERYAREKAQEEDLIAAKAQLVELISNLNETSSGMFKSTFEQANKNFQAMFSKLFGGGEAKLVLLENAEDPLECGIDIIARPPGKRPQSVTLLSGGERTMTAVALLFSIFMIKPAPFCMLDELDAALDDANIGRFVEQLKEFLSQSQFLIITHNQHTIAGSDIVYGVSQQEKGVSRVISMKLSDLGAQKS